MKLRSYSMENETKKCVDCGAEVTKKATRCLDCNSIHMRNHPPASTVASNRKIDRNIKPYMLRRGNPDKRSMSTGASCMSGGSAQ